MTISDFSSPFPQGPGFNLGDIPAKIPFSVGGVPLLPEIAPSRTPQEIKDRKGESKRIVKRLLAIKLRLEPLELSLERVDF